VKYTKKTVPLGLYIFVHNSGKCWQIFEILSLLYSPRNLQQNLYRHFQPHLKRVTALPCERQNLKLSHFRLQLYMSHK